MSEKLQTPLKEKIEEALKMVSPHLEADGGGIELVEVNDEGDVFVRLLGACHGCPGARMTLEMGVARVLKEQIPEIRNVQAV